MQEWFHSWFDTSYYHTLYSHRDDVEADRFIQNISQRVNFSSNDRVIDLPCGRGRHSFAMAKYFGCLVTGVDLSPNSVRYAKENYNRGFGSKIHFEAGDMRTFSSQTPYAALFNLFTSFGYFETLSESQNLLLRFGSLLRSGGVLVLDYLNCFKSLLDLENEKKQYRTHDRGSMIFKTEKYREGDKIIKNIEVRNQRSVHKFSEKLQLIDVEQMLEMLRFSGLEVVGIFGDYEFNPYCRDTSDRMIFWAIKP